MVAVTDVVLVAVVGVIGPVIMALLVTWQGLRMKRQDWEREDLVAERARVAALALQTTQQALVDASVVHSQQMGNIQSTVNIVHDLTNSALTAVKESELTALVAQLAMMRELAAARNTPSDSEAIVHLRERIDQLTVELAERKRNDEVAVQAARAQADEHSAAEKQQDAAAQQQQAAVLQAEAADKQIAVAEAQGRVADSQAEANRLANQDS